MASRPTTRGGAASATPTIAAVEMCDTCAADQEFLRTPTRPDYVTGDSTIRVVDLFAGGGGLTLGAAEAARHVGFATKVVLAVESADSAAGVYALNFPEANLDRSDVAKLFDGALGAESRRPNGSWLGRSERSTSSSQAHRARAIPTSTTTPVARIRGMLSTSGPPERRRFSVPLS